MIEKVKNSILTNDLITPEIQTVCVAVSGGIDSSVLLDLLVCLRSELGVTIEIVHFNHKTRGHDSDRDEDFVKGLAEQYGVDIRIGRLRKNLNKITETSLREERYRFFQKVLTSKKNSVIATGHNRNDNVETFIMRLAKGSRLRGLMAIRPARSGFIRPLLSVARSEIEFYAQKKGLKHIEDASNTDLSIQRNYLRHRILPYLRENLDKNLDQNISRTIHNLSLHYELYDEKLKEAILVSVRRSGNNISMNRERYLIYNEVVRRGLIEYCISNLYPVNYRVSDRNFIIWDQFIGEAQPGKKNTFLDSGIATAERDQIVFGDIPEARSESFLLDFNKPVIVNQKNTITVREVKAARVSLNHDRNVEFIDGEKSGKRFSVRFWQKGDRFRPLGMINHKKLSDFFIDLKLSSEMKNEVPIICNKDQIIWIAGYRLDDYFKITDETKLYYKLELKKNK